MVGVCVCVFSRHICSVSTYLLTITTCRACIHSPDAGVRLPVAERHPPSQRARYQGSQRRTATHRRRGEGPLSPEEADPQSRPRASCCQDATEPWIIDGTRHRQFARRYHPVTLAEWGPTPGQQVTGKLILGRRLLLCATRARICIHSPGRTCSGSTAQATGRLGTPARRRQRLPEAK